MELTSRHGGCCAAGLPPSVQLRGLLSPPHNCPVQISSAAHSWPQCLSHACSVAAPACRRALRSSPCRSRAGVMWCSESSQRCWPHGRHPAAPATRHRAGRRLRSGQRSLPAAARASRPMTGAQRQWQSRLAAACPAAAAPAAGGCHQGRSAGTPVHAKAAGQLLGRACSQVAGGLACSSLQRPEPGCVALPASVLSSAWTPAQGKGVCGEPGGSRPQQAPGGGAGGAVLPRWAWWECRSPQVCTPQGWPASAQADVSSCSQQRLLPGWRCMHGGALTAKRVHARRAGPRSGPAPAGERAVRKVASQRESAAPG